MVATNAVVGLTDSRWFDYLRSRSVNGRLDEVNFWRPQAQTEFRSLAVGEPFFLRLKHPMNAIAGYGYFAHAGRWPIRLAWDAFRDRNGDATFEEFVARIAEYRHETPLETALGSREVTCIVLREVRFWRDHEFIGWNQEQDWARNIVTYKRYDLTRLPGSILAGAIRNGEPQELASAFEPIAVDERTPISVDSALREGQGAFRVRLLDAYGRRCAVTGERSLPTLDAAHIQPYLGPRSNHVQNGLVLRADIHRLYDAGYVTVTSEYRFEVSKRLREDFENGRVYYALDGQPLTALPKTMTHRPSRHALEWHARTVFQ